MTEPRDVSGAPGRGDDLREEGDVPEGAVEHAPLETGTDPLGDNQDLYRRQGRLILSAVLGVLFAVLAVVDFTTGHIARGFLAVVVAVLNAYIAAKEQGKPKAPSNP